MNPRALCTTALSAPCVGWRGPSFVLGTSHSVASMLVCVSSCRLLISLLSLSYIFSVLAPHSCQVVQLSPPTKAPHICLGQARGWLGFQRHARPEPPPYGMPGYMQQYMGGLSQQYMNMQVTGEPADSRQLGPHCCCGSCHTLDPTVGCLWWLSGWWLSGALFAQTGSASETVRCIKPCTNHVHSLCLSRLSALLRLVAAPRPPPHQPPRCSAPLSMPPFRRLSPAFQTAIRSSSMCVTLSVTSGAPIREARAPAAACQEARHPPEVARPADAREHVARGSVRCGADAHRAVAHASRCSSTPCQRNERHVSHDKRGASARSQRWA